MAKADSSTCNPEIAEEAYKAIHTAESISQLVSTMEDWAAKIVGGQLATFFRLESNDNLKNLVAFRDEGRSRISFSLGQGIAGNVANENGFYICNKPTDDPMYLEAVDGLSGLDADNIISSAVTDPGTGDVLGVLQVINKTKGTFTEGDAFWLQRLSEQSGAAYTRLKRSEDGWKFARNLAEAFSSAVDDKHVSTVGHTDRVRQIALALGRDLNLSESELEELEFASLLHDLGRLALAPEAYEMVKDIPSNAGKGKAGRTYASGNDRLHLVLTEALLRDLPLPDSMANLREIALAHHEKADGTGFPSGSKAADLPLSARILAVANAFDLLTSGRADENHGKPMSDEEAAEHIKSKSGKEYDPAVVDRLIRNKLYVIEKRRFPRYEYEAPLDVEVLDTRSGDLGKESQETSTGTTTVKFESKVLDLSEGGIMFLSPNKLSPHALLKLRIYLPGDTLDAIARTARHLPPEEGEEGWRLGAFFLWYGKVK